MKLVCFILFFIVSNSAICQTSLTTSQIDSICNAIDLSIEKDTNHTYVIKISEGEFKNEGGFDREYITLDSTNALQKVISNESSDIYTTSIYYFLNYKLIKAFIKNEKRPLVTYYFSGEICLNAIGENINYSSWKQILSESNYYLKIY